ncbi:MAG: tail fiber domain-containing protein, partial [Akkermansiaceae bacterium]|nr:tail fiber domain-containing protein [Verrucomicrobiales bacterium]
MKINYLIALGIFILHSSFFISASAQGTAFTYQGRLNDGVNPAGGIYDLRFTIHDAPSAGTQQGSALTNAATSISNGLFTVVLDFGHQFPGADRWLEIAVRTNGGGAFVQLTPRQHLTATPYAIQSVNAASAIAVSGSVSAAQLTGTLSSNNIGAGSITSIMLAAGAVTTMALADGAVTAGKVATVSNSIVLRFINPGPLGSDYFGYAVAALGNDRVIIGAVGDDTGGFDSGAAYLFDANGSLLKTFVNPTPSGFDNFGVSVAAVGTDRVLIGASGQDGDAGAAYLFTTNGTLVRTFINPNADSGDRFGRSVAALDGGRVIIGAFRDDNSSFDANGRAYLFNTNGSLLMTFNNPAPADIAEFGSAVTGVGDDRVLISGGNGLNRVFLFTTNGTVQMTFTNRGSALAGLGTGRVVIGSYIDNTGAPNAGAVSLYHTNGTLLTTITNPTPALADYFGWSLAVAGDKVLVGAYQDDTGATDAGSVYLFNTNGILLATIPNPAPTTDDNFGYAVALLGTDKMVVGAFGKDLGGVPDAGAAYLFRGQTFTDGLVADAVRAGSITATSLEDGAVTFEKLDPSVGTWTKGNTGIFHVGDNVGIGTTSPQVPLHIASDPQAVMVLQDTGANATQSGYIGFWNSTPTETAWVGFGTPGSPDFSIVNARAGGNIVLSAFGGNVGIARAPTANALEVAGNASKTVAGSWLANSDARIKTEVRTVTGALEKLAQVRLVEFHYTENYRAQHPGIEDRRYLNVVAQEFQKVFPEHVQSSGEKLSGGGDAILQVDTYPLTIYSAAAIQELNQKLEAGSQKTEVRSQKSEVR